MRRVYLGQGGVDAVALVDFLVAVAGHEDDADGQDVIDLVEGDMLVLHLHPYRIRTLHAALDGVFDAHLVELLADGWCELVEDGVALGLAFGKLALDVGILFGVFVAETEVLQFGLDLVESQSVGDGGEDIDGLAGYLILLAWLHAFERPHVVQAVGNFDEDDADVVAHRQQQFFERLGLEACRLAEDAT